MKLIALLLFSFSAQAMTIEEYMKAVSERNKLLESYKISVEASKDLQVAGDLELSPQLTAGYSLASDKSLPSAVADKRDQTTANIGLSKKFSTGTTLGVSAETYKYDFEQPVVAGNNGYSRGGIGVSLQQSLWRDFFGAGTQLRRERQAALNKLETLSLELQKRQKMIEFESDYWDYLVAQEDLKLKRANLDRAKKLESWTSTRVSNGISERAELLQVRALYSNREMQLQNAIEELQAREIKMRENLNYESNQALPEATSSLTEARPFFSQLANQENIVRIDTYLSTLEAEVTKKAAESTVDSLRPDLSLVGRYSTSSYALEHSEMQSNLTKTDRPVTYVGLSFSWLFGSDAKSAQLAAARKQAIAAQYRAEQSKLSGENAWQEHLRKYELAKKNVLTLEKIAQLQRDRSREEQVRFSKGRTITLNVVDAETESAESEVNYLRARSGLKKLEASTQLFLPIQQTE
ncbi:TolC family protein [Pseudobdellovibrio exovorus]|uniref:Outer membrane protein n=1 Tax=Pseudobdellovibrio exovorus JSS TaxID=1184267 RepID=M4V7A9_9BACT|nr:TolC family protein [Pseudobdellovibrio exovorus]AGH95282.1 hypothetical protein A11Q_1066 [Pseudobdellovibrio exovorus JSS]